MNPSTSTDSNKIEYGDDYPIYPIINGGLIIQVKDRENIIPNKFRAIAANDSVSQTLNIDTERYYDIDS